MIKKTAIIGGQMLGGKSTICEELSRLTRLPFQETDDLVTQLPGVESISKFMDEKTQRYKGDKEMAWKDFRQLEKEVLVSLLTEKSKPQIIGLGGGTLLGEKSRAVIEDHKNSVVFNLDIDLETQVRRALILNDQEKEHRPAIQRLGEDELRDFFQDMQARRSELYRNFSDHSIKVREGKTTLQIAQEIMNILHQK